MCEIKQGQRFWWFRDAKDPLYARQRPAKRLALEMSLHRSKGAATQSQHVEPSEREDEAFDALTCKAVDATEDEDCHSEISASQTPPNIGTHPGIQS